MLLESSMQKAGRISIWIGSCSGLIALILGVILFWYKIGPHDEGFTYLYLLLLLAVVISFASFVIGVIISFALGLNFALSIKRGENQDRETNEDV